MKRKSIQANVAVRNTLAAKVFALRVESRLPVFQAQKICFDMADALAKEASNPERIRICETFGLDPDPEGLQLLNHVLLHLDLELRMN